MRQLAVARNRHALIFAEWFGISWAAGLVASKLFEADTIPLTVGSLSNRLAMTRATTEAALAELKAAAEPGDVINDGERWAMTECGLGEFLIALDDSKRRRRAA